MADIDDLKAAFNQVIATFNAHDLNGLMACTHEGIALFGPFSPFASDGKTAVRELYQMVFANNESSTATPINPQFRIAGSTGLSWGHLSVASKPKDGPLRIGFVRYTSTFAKEGGKWLWAANHLSYLPSGN